MGLQNSQPTDKPTIKNWFKTGLIPTQEQFWAWMDSYWHKGESIPQSSIEGLSQTLTDIQDNAGVDIESHLTDENAHAALFGTKADVDELQKYIPLAGNAVQNPVTGEIFFSISGSPAKLTKTDHGIGLSSDPKYTVAGALYHKIAHGNWVSVEAAEAQINVGAALANTEFKGIRGNRYFGAKYDDFSFTQKKYVDDKLSLFTTQEILSGGNYNNLEVTADLLVFKNENAQAILNGVWGKKDFHILNLSNTYEVKINHNSTSVTGNGQPIKLPTASGNMGIKGTARILQTAGYGYFVADTWGSLYRPEYKDLTKTVVQTVDEFSKAGSMETTEFMVFRDAQSVAMSKADLNTAYPLAKRPFQVVCNVIKTMYLKVDDNNNDWKEFPLKDVM